MRCVGSPHGQRYSGEHQGQLGRWRPQRDCLRSSRGPPDSQAQWPLNHGVVLIHALNGRGTHRTSHGIKELQICAPCSTDTGDLGTLGSGHRGLEVRGWLLGLEGLFMPGSGRIEWRLCLRHLYTGAGVCGAQASAYAIPRGFGFGFGFARGGALADAWGLVGLTRADAEG